MDVVPMFTWISISSIRFAKMLYFLWQNLKKKFQIQFELFLNTKIFIIYKANLNPKPKFVIFFMSFSNVKGVMGLLVLSFLFYHENSHFFANLMVQIAHNLLFFYEFSKCEWNCGVLWWIHVFTNTTFGLRYLRILA